MSYFGKINAIITKMELPWLCKNCTQECMVDFENLESWPLDKIMTAQGFHCKHCGTRNVVAFVTVSLEEQMRKLSIYQPGHPKFSFLFKKTLRKAKGINLRGEALYGEIGCKDMATARPMG